jgi:hypothetical protein
MQHYNPATTGCHFIQGLVYWTHDQTFGRLNLSRVNIYCLQLYVAIFVVVVEERIT